MTAHTWLVVGQWAGIVTGYCVLILVVGVFEGWAQATQSRARCAELEHRMAEIEHRMATADTTTPWGQS